MTLRMTKNFPKYGIKLNWLLSCKHFRTSRGKLIFVLRKQKGHAHPQKNQILFGSALKL